MSCMFFEISLRGKGFKAETAGERAVSCVLALVDDQVRPALVGIFATWPDAVVACHMHVMGLKVIAHGT
jgi:hypothetical protein